MNRIPWNKRCAVMGCGMFGTEPYLGLKWCLTHLNVAQRTHANLRLYAPVSFMVIFFMTGVWLLPLNTIMATTFLVFGMSVMVIDRAAKRRLHAERREEKRRRKAYERPSPSPVEEGELKP